MSILAATGRRERRETMTGAGTSLGPDKYLVFHKKSAHVNDLSKLNNVCPSSTPSVYCHKQGLSVPLHLTTSGQ